DIGDAQLTLEEAPEPEEAAVAVRAAQAQQSPLWWVLVGILSAVSLAAGAIAWRTMRSAPARPLMRLSVELGSDAVLGRSNGGQMVGGSAGGNRPAAPPQRTHAQEDLASRPVSRRHST